MSYWTVVQTETQRESTARQLIMRLGFTTYKPRIRVQQRVESLFPGYIFVQIGPEGIWYPVRWTMGVVRVLMSGDRPAAVHDDVIDGIRSRERGGFVKLPAHPKRLKKGDHVRVSKGSFCGHVGLCDGTPSRERVKILLELLGRKVSVELRETDLERLDVVAP